MGDSPWIAQDWVSDSTYGLQVVEITGRRDGAAFSIGDAIGMGMMVGGAYAGYPTFIAGAGLAEIGGAIAIGSVAGGFIGVAAIFVIAGGIYVMNEYGRNQNPNEVPPSSIGPSRKAGPARR